MTLDDVVFPGGILRKGRIFYGHKIGQTRYMYSVRLEALKEVELSSKWQRIDLNNEARRVKDMLYIRRRENANNFQYVTKSVKVPYNTVRQYLSQSI